MGPISKSASNKLTAMSSKLLENLTPRTAFDDFMGVNQNIFF